MLVLRYICILYLHHFYPSLCSSTLFMSQVLLLLFMTSCPIIVVATYVYKYAQYTHITYMQPTESGYYCTCLHVWRTGILINTLPLVWDLENESVKLCIGDWKQESSRLWRQIWVRPEILCKLGKSSWKMKEKVKSSWFHKDPHTHRDKIPELLLSLTKSGLVKDCFPTNEKNYSLFIPRSADSDQLNWR